MSEAQLAILQKVHSILVKEYATVTWNQVPNEFQLQMAKNLVEGIITLENQEEKNERTRSN